MLEIITTIATKGETIQHNTINNIYTENDEIINDIQSNNVASMLNKDNCQPPMKKRRINHRHLKQRKREMKESDSDSD